MVMNCSSIAATRPSRAPAVAAAHLDRIVQADVERAAQEQQRPFEPRRGAFNRELHRWPPCGRRELRELALDPRLELGERCELVVGDLLAHALQRAHAAERADALGLDAGRQRRLGEIDEAAEQPHHRAPAAAGLHTRSISENADWRRNASSTSSAHSSVSCCRPATHPCR